ncbi:MAG: VPS10 domain-containing protein [Chitinophagaceae bacterium]
MRNLRHSVALVFLFAGAQAQQVSPAAMKSWKPRNIGPAGMSGRITTIDALASDPNTIYVGAASGGVWKTTSGGAAWTPVFDDQPILNIGSLAIQQNNPSVVWVGTGEGNPRNSVSLGEGIYKTLDGGNTWKCMGLEKTRNIHRVLIDPLSPNTVYAGAIGNPFAAHPERGVFKTTDGGTTWNKILYTNDSSGVGDMVMDPSNPNKLLVAMWQHFRTPYSFKSGGKGSGLYLTFDGGKTWEKLGKEHGLPEGDYGRIGLTISRSNPNRIYALVEATKNGLYKTDDGGKNWSLVNSDPQWVTNRPFYFQEIFCDPQNENRLWLIYQQVAMSEDGGKSFGTVLPYSGIHPDHHAFWINPNNGNFVLDGNDGGIGISRDRGKSWQFDEKLPVGQFYHIAVDNQMPYNVMGGMQDNGSWHGPAYTWINGGIRNYYWQSIWGGDGFDMMPDAEDPNWVYAMSQGGSVGRYHIPTGERWNIKPLAPDTNTRLRFNWNAAIAQDPFNPGTIYFGSQLLHKSTNKGATWSIISPDLTTDNKQQQDQSENGGLSLDITSAENYNTIICIAPSFKEKDVLWVGTDDGNVQLTRDGGKTWTNFRNKITGMPTGSWIPQIRTSKHNAGEAWVVANDYRRGDMKPYVFRTTDYGKTWSRIVDEKKVTGYALTVLQDPVEPNLVFVGTEQGLWVSLDGGGTFTQWKNGYPSVSTYDLAIQEREADLAIATFGRALWILDDIRPLRGLAQGKGKAPASALKVFAAPDAIQAQYRNAPGYEWSTMGLYDAENRPRGAAISYYISKKEKADSVVRVSIYNDKHERIRSLSWDADSGLNRRYWGMEERGFRSPGGFAGRGGGRGGAMGGGRNTEPGGWQALPGTYKLVLEYGGSKDSATINLLDDPRLGNRNEVKMAQRAMLTRLRKSGDSLSAGIEKLTSAEESMKKVEAAFAGQRTAIADSIVSAGKKLTADIKAFREELNGVQRERQGYGNVPQVTIMSELSEANQAITARPLVPGAYEEQQVAEAELKIAAWVKKVNTWAAGPLKAYQTLVESGKPRFFR